MPPLFSRIRKRALSQSTITSDCTLHPISTFEAVTPTVLTPVSQSIMTSASYETGSIVSRKILSDISGLFDSNSADIPGTHSPMRGLRPPRSRRSTLTNFITKDARDSLGEENSVDFPSAVQDSQVLPWNEEDVAESRSPRQGRSLSTRRCHETVSENTPWSTFGWHNEQLTPPPSQRKGTGYAARTSPTNRSPEHPRSSESPRTRSSSNTDTHANSSPQDTVSFRSQADTIQSSKTPSQTDHSEHSSFVQSIYATPATHVFGSESPCTFGYPSPSSVRSGSRDRRRPSASPSPPPPLPPLNHPELILSLASRSRSRSNVHTAQDENTPPQVDSFGRNLNIRPSASRRSKGKTKDIRQARMLSVRYTFGRSAVKTISLPSAQRIPRESTETLQIRSRNPSKTRPRSKSDPTTRRSSAYWCAERAAAGVNAHIPGLYGWPAEVSREILKLSLGEHAVVKSRNGGLRSHKRPAITVQRGGNVPAGLICDSLSCGGPPCLLVPSSPSTPVTLQPPILLQSKSPHILLRKFLN